MEGGGFDVSPRSQVDRWFVQVSRERVRWDRASSRGDLGEFVGRLVVASGDVDELEAMELVLESKVTTDRLVGSPPAIVLAWFCRCI